MMPNPDRMPSMDELTLMTALNVLRDSVESQMMPSGMALTSEALVMHERAIDQLATLLQKIRA